MSLPAAFLERREALRFCLRFAGWLLLLALLFPWVRDVIAHVHLLPVAAVATVLLKAVGVQATLDSASLVHGHATLDVARVTYLVTHECTGIYALLLLAAAVLAYPATPRDRLRGFILGVPALYAFGALRLFVLGVVAQLRPEWIDLFHEYLMEVVSIAFVLYVWVTWIDRIVTRGRA